MPERTKLKINIKELQNLPEKELEIVFQEKIQGVEAEYPVKANLKVSLASYGVNIKGHLETDLQLQCDRCLQNYTYHIGTEFNEDFVNESVVPCDTKEYELTEGQFVDELRDKDEIDISDFLYQTVVLETPTQKICKDTCLGSEAYQKLSSEKYIDERLEVFKSFSENNFNDE